MTRDIEREIVKYSLFICFKCTMHCLAFSFMCTLSKNNSFTYSCYFNCCLIELMPQINTLINFKLPQYSKIKITVKKVAKSLNESNVYINSKKRVYFICFFAWGAKDLTDINLYTNCLFG